MSAVADTPLFDLVVEQSRHTPDAVIADGETTVTLAELCERAGRLATHLRDLGVGSETVVGVCVQRSVDMLVALLGILGAGGAFLPLDPDQPPARLGLMLDDAQPPVVVTTSTDVVSLPRFAGTVLRLDADRSTWMATAVRTASGGGPTDLAYVMFTSGSTGRPKGVMVEHRSLVNHLTWRNAHFGVTAADRMVQKTPLGFDPALAEIFCPLLAGASLTLLAPGEHADARRLVEVVGRDRVTMLWLVPSVLEAFLGAAGDADLDCVRLVTCGGETLRPALVHDVLARLGDAVELHNMYGPTETVISATSWRCDLRSDDPVPVGTPVANTEVHVLDDELRPVPQGTAGELCVGGVQVARGYLRRPDLDSHRFVPDPSRPGARLYRTGDMGRMRDDGAIEFLGRRDSQVKVRGVRIELGEIDEVLGGLPTVRRAVTTVQADDRGELHLVAFVVPRDPQASLPSAALAAALRAELPETMVPAVFVHMDDVPVTASGKVDVARLPAVNWSSRHGSTFVAPRSPTEATLALLWARVLGVDRVGIDDGFVDLGGHSLLAVRMLVEVERDMGVRIDLPDMFERGQTVAGLASLVDAAAVSRAPGGTISARAGGGPAPLSATQAQLWYFSRLVPDNSVYNEAFTLRRHGNLDAECLHHALNEVVRRHEILRTTFDVLDGEPVQVIHPPEPISCELLDLREWPGEQREKRAIACLRSLAEREYDLTTGPLLRAVLIRVDDSEHRLHLALHHLVFDGASMHTLAGELVVIYEALVGERQHALPAPAIQFADYATWEQGWMEGTEFAARVAHWSEVLSDAPALRLPLDRPRPSVQRFRGEAVSFDLPDHVTNALRATSSRDGATLFQALLASFAVLMQRWSGQDDVVIGTLADQRDRIEMQSMLGYCVTPVVIREDLSGDPTFDELVRRLRADVLDGISNLVPFERLVREVRPPREPGANPIFQVVVSMLRSAVPPWPGWDAPAPAEPLSDTVVGPVKFDIHLELSELSSRQVHGRLMFDTAIFERATMERLVRGWTTLLQAIAGTPGARISELPVVGDAERRLQLVDWNSTDAAQPEHPCVHVLASAQAARTPEAIAVRDRVNALSFRDLDERAGRLAQHLRDAGVGPEVLVGVCMERSCDLVVAMLAVLKAGGAYLPLEPDLPSARLGLMVEDARPRVILTSSGCAERVPSCSVEQLVVDEARDQWMQAEPIAADPACDPANLAYVIYTSGSTGRPKGVMIEHRAIVNQLLWRVGSFGLRPGDRVLQKTPLGFDVSLWELLCPLVCGATMVLLEPGAQSDPAAIAATIRREGVTAAHFVPSMLQTFLAVGAAEGCDSLRLVACSGEALNAPLVRRFVEVFGPTVELRNLYGPTEAAVDVTSWRCDPADEVVPIGRPVDNTRVYVLDARLQPVPVGAPGELCIGGLQVARGYRGRPELSSERFVADHLRGEGRMYRTGDVARFRPDGVLEFLGRGDTQVKIRGHRIELGEVEAALLGLPAIAEVAVTVQPGADGDQRLVAYAVARAGFSLPTHRELSVHLAATLPAAMIPAALVRVAAMPLTASGKLDRGALPVHEWTSPSSGSAVGPRSDLEARLATIWAAVLHIRHVGVHDDFFELGGHSLLAVHLVLRVEQELGISIPLASFFERATVAGMAAALEAAPGATAARSLVIPVERGDDRAAVFFIHADESTMLSLRHFRGPLGPDQRIVGLLPERDGRVFDLSRSVEQLAAPMADLIRSVQPEGPYYIAGFSFGGLLAYEVASRLREAGETLAWLVLLDTMTPDVSLHHMWLRSPGGFLTRLRERGPHRAVRKVGRAAGAIVRRAVKRVRHAPPEVVDDFDWQGARALQRRYQCRPNDAPMELFVSADAADYARNPSLGWEAVHRGPMTVRAVPGVHLSIVSEPQVHDVARVFAASLRNAQQAHGAAARGV